MTKKKNARMKINYFHFIPFQLKIFNDKIEFCFIKITLKQSTYTQ